MLCVVKLKGMELTQSQFDIPQKLKNYKTKKCMQITSSQRQVRGENKIFVKNK